MKLIQRARQLLTASPHVGRSRPGHFDGRIRQRQLRRLIDDHPVNPDKTRQDQASCILTTGDQSPIDQHTIEPFSLWTDFLNHILRWSFGDGGRRSRRPAH